MPVDAVSRAQMDYVLRNLGYTTIIADEGGFVYYYDEASSPLYPLMFDFSAGLITWEYVQWHLEWGGVNIDAFCALLDAL